MCSSMAPRSGLPWALSVIVWLSSWPACSAWWSCMQMMSPSVLLSCSTAGPPAAASGPWCSHSYMSGSCFLTPASASAWWPDECRPSMHCQISTYAGNSGHTSWPTSLLGSWWISFDVYSWTLPEITNIKLLWRNDPFQKRGNGVMVLGLVSSQTVSSQIHKLLVGFPFLKSLFTC